MDFHVAGAFELFEDDVIHARAGVDQGGGDDRQRAPFFDVTRGTEEALRARNVTISDPVQAYDEFYVGSFLDSEGNKLWFCSPV